MMPVFSADAGLIKHRAHSRGRRDPATLRLPQCSCYVQQRRYPVGDEACAGTRSPPRQIFSSPALRSRLLTEEREVP